MSDPKRATLITVNPPKKEKNKVKKTVRLTINLDESNESKYPELNYKELVIAEVRKKPVENGKTAGLNPFSDSDEDVERVARKFEQKYGGKSTYGKKTKQDDYADIGAGYDENDPFIDNGDGYDEIFPPELETYYGGFYINSGLLEFKNSDNAPMLSDGEPNGSGRRNKRRISSSSSGDESSDSSTDSRSQDVKEPKLNGTMNTHKTEHRKKKNKKFEKKPKKIRRTDSSAATSGKQTSDDPAESVDSRTSQSDSTSKPAPSSENPVTSDSSRDVEAKTDIQLPTDIVEILEEISTVTNKIISNNPEATYTEIEAGTQYIMDRLVSQVALQPCGGEALSSRVWAAAEGARAQHRPRHKQGQHHQHNQHNQHNQAAGQAAAQAPAQAQTKADTKDLPDLPAAPAPPPAPAHPPLPATEHKRKSAHSEDFSHLTESERQAKIEDTLQRLKELIEERKPQMMANYSAECERVKEERIKLQQACADGGGGPAIEKRLPKRRFPWCPQSRALLVRLRALAGCGAGVGEEGAGEGAEAALLLLARRALPLFPKGFVRMPTLLRQADLNKELKMTDIKRPRLGSSSNPQSSIAQNATPAVSQPSLPIQIPEQIHFPSSLTVTTSMAPKSTDKNELSVNTNDSKYKSTSVFGSIINSFSLSKELVVDKQEERRKESVIVEKSKEDLYIPPNNIGSITITPVPSLSKVDKKQNITDRPKEALLRVKSPAALNEMVQKKDKLIENLHKKDKEKHKKSDKSIHGIPIHKERIDTPLHIETNFQTKHKEPSPSPKTKEEITKKQIENMRIAENNIPRPALVPVHHSPTFAKPDKRPPEIKKKKDLLIVSDVDPLGDTVSIDDSSSDVEVIEDKCEKSEVPSKDSERNSAVKQSDKDAKSEMDEAMKEDFNSIMKNLRDLENSQEPKFNNAFGGVITSVKHDTSSNFARPSIFRQTRPDKDKFTERASLNKMDGCSALTG